MSSFSTCYTQMQTNCKHLHICSAIETFPPQSHISRYCSYTLIFALSTATKTTSKNEGKSCILTVFVFYIFSNHPRNSLNCPLQNFCDCIIMSRQLCNSEPLKIGCARFFSNWFRYDHWRVWNTNINCYELKGCGGITEIGMKPQLFESSSNGIVM